MSVFELAATERGTVRETAAENRGREREDKRTTDGGREEGRKGKDKGKMLRRRHMVSKSLYLSLLNLPLSIEPSLMCIPTAGLQLTRGKNG